MALPGTRQSLLVRLSKQHQPSWFEFAEVYEPFLRNLVRRHGVPDSDCEDVVQQIMLGVTKSLDSFSDDGRPESFRRWLNVVARNAAIKFMTGERKRSQAAGGTDMLAAFQNLSNDESDLKEQDLAGYRRELIVWAAESVKNEFQPNSWAAFRETMINHRSVDEVASELNVSAGSIYMSRSRVLARIRQKVSAVEQDPSP